jgi:hypothetical protein
MRSNASRAAVRMEIATAGNNHANTRTRTRNWLVGGPSASCTSRAALRYSSNGQAGTPTRPALGVRCGSARCGVEPPALQARTLLVAILRGVMHVQPAAAADKVQANAEQQGGHGQRGVPAGCRQHLETHRAACHGRKEGATFKPSNVLLPRARSAALSRWEADAGGTQCETRALDCGVCATRNAVTRVSIGW